MRQTGKRRRTERKRDSRRFPNRIGWEAVIAVSCPQIPKGEGKATPTSPTQLTKDCIACSILLLTRQIPLTDSYSGAKKRILRVGQAGAKISPPIQIYTDVLCGPAKILHRKGCRGSSMSLLKTTPHNHFLWVMSHDLFPLLLPCFFSSCGWFDTQRLCQKNITSLFVSRDFWCTEYSLKM